MAPHTMWHDFSDAFADRWLTQAVVTFSSSASARETAAAWMTTYESAVAVGLADDEAHAQADHAYCLALYQAKLPPVVGGEDQ